MCSNHWQIYAMIFSSLLFSTDTDIYGVLLNRIDLCGVPYFIALIFFFYYLKEMVTAAKKTVGLIETSVFTPRWYLRK